MGRQRKCNRSRFSKISGIFRLQPRLLLIVTADLPGHLAFARIDEGKVSLEYDLSPVCNALVLRSKNSYSESMAISQIELLPTPQGILICPDRRKRLQSAIFHIMNFPDFLCTNGSTDLFPNHESDSSKGWKRLGRVFLEDDNFQIEIQALEDTDERAQTLKAEGGYGITHVGRITRRNGKTFTIAALKRTLREIHLCLSFARGLWTPVILPVAFDAQGNRVFEEWGIGLGVAWEPRETWFDDDNSQSLAELYPGFITLLRDSDLGDAVSYALYWYLRSNRAGSGAGVDGGLILSQAALERLAYAYLVKNGSPPRSNTPAGVVLERACKNLGLRTAIPRTVSGLYNARRRQGGTRKWQHALHALVAVRNELVPDAWNLSQWYISLMILKLSSFKGQYSNRLRTHWRGQVEDVPWT